MSRVPFRLYMCRFDLTSYVFWVISLARSSVYMNWRVVKNGNISSIDHTVLKFSP